MEFMNVRYIVNPIAGKGQGLIYGKNITDYYDKRNRPNPVAYTTESGSNSGFELGKKFALEGIKRIGVLGGDGTLNGVQNGIIASRVSFEARPAIGIIPLGTGNNASKNAKFLRIDSAHGIEKAINAVENGAITSIDLGKLIWNGREQYFVTVVSGGFDAVITKTAAELREKNQTSKIKSYFSAATKEINSGFSSYRIKLKTPEFSIKEDLILIAILNGKTYGGNFKICPKAKLTDGILDTCKIRNFRRFKKIKSFITLFLALFGWHPIVPEVKLGKIVSLTLSSENKIPCEIDGEVLAPEELANEYRIDVVPSAAKFIVSSSRR